MARFTAVGLDQVQPLTLDLDVGRNAIAFGSGSGKLTLIGHLHQRIPVIPRIIGGSSFCIRGYYRGEVHNLTWRGLRLLRIYQPVASSPNAVRRLGKIG